MQQKTILRLRSGLMVSKAEPSKFITVITLICFISLLFLPGKAWSSHNDLFPSGGGGDECDPIEKCVEGHFEFIPGYGNDYICTKTEVIKEPPSSCFSTPTTKEKEEKTYPYKACAGGCKEGQCVYHQSTDPSRSDECQSDADCRAPTPPAQYSCNQCRGTTCSVRYSSSPCSNTCITDADCRVPTRPSNGGTPPSNGGTPPSNGWTPPSNGGTPSPPTGGWTPPPPPPKYSCNQSTWTCYQNSSGPYSSLSSCQSACVEPPCMINYFEFPKRAWVGYSITGRWSASDWCVDCDVTCTPYPECVWKQDNIGTGFDEHEFTLEQSGDYIYTLTCYKQGGRDQKQVTVSLEALNLPWWREIIPVLPGFLRGIWK